MTGWLVSCSQHRSGCGIEQARVTASGWMNEWKDEYGFCPAQSLSTVQGSRLSWPLAQASYKESGRAWVALGIGSNDQATPGGQEPGRVCLPMESLLTHLLPAHKVHLCPPSHTPSMVHEISLQKETSLRGRPAPRNGSIARNLRNWPGRGSWSMLGQRAKHELTLLLIIVRACTGLHSLQRHSIWIISWILSETPWTGRAGINHPCSRDKEPGESQRRSAVPKVTQWDRQVGLRLRLWALSSAPEFRESQNLDGKKKKSSCFLISN